MPLMAPDVGEVELLKRLLYANAGSENGTFRLYQNNVTYAESDVAATYTISTFTNYADKTLTSSQSGATWAVPTTAGGVTTSTYGTAFNWLPGSTQTCYGYIIVGATSTILWAVEAFAAGKPLQSGDSLTITAKIGLD